jgi:thiol-disulfide isomerase/thioredoxin
MGVMAETPSSMLPLGSPLPPFSLPGLDGRRVADTDVAGAAALVVAFLCPHCPYVAHIREALARLARDYTPRGVAFVAINSNDANQYPEDGPEGMKREAASAGYTFPYLRDEGQSVARAFRAACTPDLYVFARGEAGQRLVYRGQFDDSRPHRTGPATGADLQAALDAVLAGQAVSTDQRPSVGCNIKWKPGQAPRYA